MNNGILEYDKALARLENTSWDTKGFEVLAVRENQNLKKKLE